MLTITVRQTRDPYVADIQYIAYSKITLPDNTDLSLHNIGVGQPGDEFVVVYGQVMFVPNIRSQSFPPDAIELIIRYEAEPDPFLTVVEVHDVDAAYKHLSKRLSAQHRAEQIAYVKGLFVCAGTCMTFPFRLATYLRYHWHRIRTTPPNPEGSTFSSRSAVSVSWRHKGSGKYLKL